MSNLFLASYATECGHPLPDKCFVVINTVSDEKLAVLANGDFYNPTLRAEFESIGAEIKLLIQNNQRYGYPQFFNPRRLYIPAKCGIKLITEDKQQIVESYIDTFWKDYEDRWNYQEGFKVVSQDNMLFLTVWSNVHILETYNVQIKKVENSSFQENVESDSVLIVYPDATIKNADPYYLINNIPQSSPSILQHSSAPINISTSHTVFLVKLTPKV